MPNSLPGHKAQHIIATAKHYAGANNGDDPNWRNGDYKRPNRVADGVRIAIKRQKDENTAVTKHREHAGDQSCSKALHLYCKLK